MTFKQEKYTVIDQDNKSMIALANHPMNHAQMKHIDVAHHFIRENIKDKMIEL